MTSNNDTVLTFKEYLDLIGFLAGEVGVAILEVERASGDKYDAKRLERVVEAKTILKSARERSASNG